MTGESAGPLTPASSRGGSLAWRLGLLLGGIVVAVLLLIGLVVNRVVSSGYQSVLAVQQQERLQTAADALVDSISRPAPVPRVRAQLQRLATSLGGVVTVLGPNGRVIVAAGQRPSGDLVSLDVPISADGQQLGTLHADLPAGVADRGFLRLFNLTLVGAGLVSLIGIVLLALYGTSRLTRPLRTVVDAAHRLGSGDLTARARGGPDGESAELADAFNSMADRLQRSESLRRRAASDMAHDLATPATVLESQLQAMIDGVVPADREQLEAARSAAGALGSVIGQMGELASAESAPLQRRVERVELTQLVGEVARSLEGLARERGVALIVEPAAATTSVWLDRDQLARALRNVVTNAAQHTPADGAVRLSLATTPDAVQVRVMDAGPGIAPEDLPHVFERFYRADRARSAEENGSRQGSGIGLTIARELVTANGGRISVERTSAAGTTFLMELPRSD
ncbi:MAG: HAMP domain-containing histidine kinase [Chloroflexi bacterium]|nr:MAG: HAMP domain-containing histidine kinase [Chloroflexota bacterium]